MRRVGHPAEQFHQYIMGGASIHVGAPDPVTLDLDCIKQLCFSVTQLSCYGIKRMTNFETTFWLKLISG